MKIEGRFDFGDIAYGFADVRGHVGDRLFAALGIAVRDWVSYFGAYVNIHPYLDLYRRVHCDPSTTEPMTSLERERRGRVRPAHVRERLIDHVRTGFGFDRVSLFSDHPSLAGYVQRCQPQRAELSGVREVY